MDVKKETSSRCFWFLALWNQKSQIMHDSRVYAAWWNWRKIVLRRFAVMNCSRLNVLTQKPVAYRERVEKFLSVLSVNTVTQAKLFLFSLLSATGINVVSHVAWVTLEKRSLFGASDYEEVNTPTFFKNTCQKWSFGRVPLENPANFVPKLPF